MDQDGPSGARHDGGSPGQDLRPAGLVAAAFGLGLEALVAMFDAVRLLGEATLQEETLGLAGIRLLNREAPAAGALIVLAVIAVAALAGLLGRSRAAWLTALALQAVIGVDALVRLPSEPLPAALALLVAGVVALTLLRPDARRALRPPA
jgi:hypothetical protein